MKTPCVYILTNKKNGTLYIGVTSDPIKRLWQHRSGQASGFAHEHDCQTLVYIEHHETMESAIIREKQLKNWKRTWKQRLIEEHNPNWLDLSDTLMG